MRLKNKLQNPFALIGQGFVAGAAIFFATAPDDSRAPQGAQTAQPSVFTAKIFDA